jgi:heat-inducible transcriptional repressor
MEREKIVLKYIIEQHISSGVPVGSNALAQYLPLHLSTASIRSIMADLEKQGFLNQPHTSAGRIPTDAGYRMYIDEMLDYEIMDDDGKEQITSAITEFTRHINRISEAMEEILLSSSKTLAHISRELGIVLAPRFNFSIFDRINLYPIESDRVLVELNLKSGFVKTVIWDIDIKLTVDELHQISMSLNERLNGLTVDEIRKTLNARLKNLQNQLDKTQAGFIQLVMQMAGDLFNFENPHALNVSGTNHILNKPDFSDQQEVHSLIALLENTQHIVQLLNRRSQQPGLNITVGQENEFKEMNSCAVITANYQWNGVNGSVAVIGPKRMSYARLIPIVLFTARTLEHTLNNT